ncbi:methionine/alanine import family NSS transporter small subunit [Microbacterium excoecariae]|nr:methionine/alanine import family NSS transporter small subunit [Microbacterium excoecariae]NHI15619.1 methionine/alanine import family NSS transporter small subunit [Microbacterium excoecariae]
MSAIAIVFFVIAAVLVWGGLVAAVLALAARPEVASYPEGGEQDGPGAA